MVERGRAWPDQKPGQAQSDHSHPPRPRAFRSPPPPGRHGSPPPKRAAGRRQLAGTPPPPPPHRPRDFDRMGREARPGGGGGGGGGGDWPAPPPTPPPDPAEWEAACSRDLAAAAARLRRLARSSDGRCPDPAAAAARLVPLVRAAMPHARSADQARQLLATLGLCGGGPPLLAPAARSAAWAAALGRLAELGLPRAAAEAAAAAARSGDVPAGVAAAHVPLALCAAGRPEEAEEALRELRRSSGSAGGPAGGGGEMEREWRGLACRVADSYAEQVRRWIK
jgi:hypothetical protein